MHAAAPFTVTHEDGATIVRFTEQADAATFELAIRASVEFEAGPELWDVRAVVVSMSAADIKNLAFIAKKKKRRPRKVAVLVGDTLSFGMLRMYSVYREQSNVDLQVFRDEAQALNWLCAG